MQKKRNWLIIISAFWLVLLCGVAIGCLVKDWPLLVLKYEVDAFSAITSLLSMVLTLMLAWWVSVVVERDRFEIEKGGEANRVEKDLIIKRIDEIIIFIGDLNQKVNSHQVEYSLASSQLKKISKTLFELIAIVESTSIKLSGSHKVDISNSLSVLKSLITNTPINEIADSDEVPLTVRNGTIYLSLDRRLLIDTEFDKIRSLLFAFELSINKG